MPSKLVKVHDSKRSGRKPKSSIPKMQPYRKYNYLKLTTIKEEGQTCDSNREPLKVGDKVWKNEFGNKWCL